MIQEWKKAHFRISTDRERLDLSVIHEFLSNSYWAKGIPIETLKKAIQGSLCFGIYDEIKQVGFARVISDYSTFAYLADVFVSVDYRGQGLSSWLMECINEHPELQGLRRWVLVTRDAHGLYEKFGFKQLAASDRYMEILRPNIYDQSVT